ncbi:MAG: hypothetical protein E7635_00290 [Ruminococcaceae bacterium]|nr:hypothetical protein [Oscillospiraceae bacterium]
MKNQRTITVRISEDLLAKLAYVSESEGRTLNNQFLLLARNSVAYFEKNKGRIDNTKANSALEKLDCIVDTSEE